MGKTARGSAKLFYRVNVFICFLICSESSVFAQESRIAPLRKDEGSFEESVFSLGISRIQLENRTAQRFKVDSPGVTLAWRQYIWGSWFGGLRLNTTEWEAKKQIKESLGEQSVSDVTFFQAESEVRWNPKFRIGAEGSLLQSISGYVLRPYFGFGLGAIFFLKNKGFPVERSKIERTQPSISLIFGNKFVLNDYLALGACWEKFRGVKTFDYSGNKLMLEVMVGDVGIPLK